MWVPPRPTARRHRQRGLPWPWHQVAALPALKGSTSAASDAGRVVCSSGRIRHGRGTSFKRRPSSGAALARMASSPGGAASRVSSAAAEAARGLCESACEDHRPSVKRINTRCPTYLACRTRSGAAASRAANAATGGALPLGRERRRLPQLQQTSLVESARV